VTSAQFQVVGKVAGHGAVCHQIPGYLITKHDDYFYAVFTEVVIVCDPHFWTVMLGNHVWFIAELQKSDTQPQMHGFQMSV
jgi:hypothetical protein